MSKVLVVDDSAFMCKMIVQMIESDPAFEIVGIARNGQDALEQAQRLRPDVITLDIEMPIMDGLTAPGKIKAFGGGFNPHVLMCSSLTEAGSKEALRALRIGASDVIAKDPGVVGKGDENFKAELLHKLHALSSSKLRTRPGLKTDNTPHASAAPPPHTAHHIEIDPSKYDVIVVGSSTGGPPVLEHILSGVRAELPVPIIIAQHMPELFTRSLVERFGKTCPCKAVLAESGVVLSQPGIYVAQGGKHLSLTRVAGKRVVARTLEQYPGAVYKPSVDLLFSTAAEIFGERVLAIQLTGMGEDGCKGARAVQEAGGDVIAQEESTCVVYGMPKAVVNAGLASAVCTPQQIRSVIALFGGAATTAKAPAA